MKTAKTISMSIPSDLLDKLDNVAKEKHISRSTLLTVLVAEYFAEDKGGIKTCVIWAGHRPVKV